MLYSPKIIFIYPKGLENVHVTYSTSPYVLSEATRLRKFSAIRF